MITVVMPAFNAMPYVNEAIQSVAAQRRSGVELVLIDDGSTDGLADIAPGLPEWVRYLSQPNQGPPVARNRGVKEAKGEWIAFLDADDLWTEGHLDRLEAAFQRTPGAGIAQGRMRQFYIDPAGTRHESGPYRMPYLGSCLFHRSVFARAGGFDERMRLSDDYDMLFRCWEHDIPKADVEDVSLLYRRHPANTTRGDAARFYTGVIKRRLERVRAGLVPPGPRAAVFEHYIGEISGADQWTSS